jgi:esterase
VQLFHTTVGTGPRVALVVHGILGSGNNWRGFCKRLAERCPDWRFVLVDLRGHGRSRSGSPPHTVQAAAEDLLALPLEPEALIGHSFGGKVVLAAAATRSSSLEQVWVLDAQPGPLVDAADHSEVVRVIAALRGVPQPLAGRSELVDLLKGLGFSRSLALWMTTNLKQTPEGLVWRFDLDVVEQLIADYFERDLWPLLENPPMGTELHVLRAMASDRWSPEELERFEALPPWRGTELHELPDSGHWVHVDNPNGLLEILCTHLS